jgi:hypothetical protein
MHTTLSKTQMDVNQRLAELELQMGDDDDFSQNQSISPPDDEEEDEMNRESFIWKTDQSSNNSWQHAQCIFSPIFVYFRVKLEIEFLKKNLVDKNEAKDTLCHGTYRVSS